MKHKICGDCEHYTACASWNIGSISSMDAAHCANFKKVATSDECKTIEAAPMKHGKWFDAMVGELPVQVCDQCNTFFPLAYTGGGHHYCPNCGAKMDLEE